VRRLRADGTEYEINLNAGHAKERRDALARYVDAAHRVRGSARKPARGLNTAGVREGARAQGIEVKDRGWESTSSSPTGASRRGWRCTRSGSGTISATPGWTGAARKGT
jgi:Lsr2